MVSPAQSPALQLDPLQQAYAGMQHYTGDRAAASLMHRLLCQISLCLSVSACVKLCVLQQPIRLHMDWSASRFYSNPPWLPSNKPSNREKVISFPVNKKRTQSLHCFDLKTYLAECYKIYIYIYSINVFSLNEIRAYYIRHVVIIM